jgi:type IV pilus secretin PilQ/predicted competence protein
MKKNIILKLCLSIVGLMLLFGCATTSGTKEASSEEEIAVITDISIEDAKVVIKSNKDFIYTVYSANDPYKITIEIPGISIGKFTGKIVSDKYGITEIIPQQITTPNAVAKVDIMLQTPSAVSPSYNDNTLVLSIKKEEPVVLSEPKAIESKSGDGPVLAIAETPANVAKAAEENIQPVPKATEISGVEIKKTADAVKVLITGNGNIIPNVFPVNERIVIDIPDVSLNTTLPESVISPLKGIRAGKHKGKLRLVLDLKQKTNFDVTAIGNSIEISLLAKETLVTQANNNSKKTDIASTASDVPAKPAQPAQEPENLIEGEYSGKKISLDFQDADVRPIFRLLADVSGYNLVLHPDVKGNVTIKLLNVPWDQALDIMLNLNKPTLAKSIEGNILWIAPTNVLTQMAEEKQKAKDSGEKTEELEQEIVHVNYAEAADISAAVNNGKLLSPRGNIAIDSRMNTLILKDTQKSIDKIKELVVIMDVPKPQVMIEAKIVEVSTNYSEALGIRWGGTAHGAGIKGLGNEVDAAFAVNTPVATPTTSGVNPGGVLGMTIGNVNNIQINMSLSALESIGKSKTLSNPRVLTMDNEAANIQQGRTFFVQTISTQGSPVTESKTATLSLDVTPKITPDGYIQLKVAASDDSIESGSGNETIVSTKKLSTNALIKSGETLVLGGIYTTSTTESEDGVPLLNKIPVLGWLFKTKNFTGPNTKEMLIFLTPTIVTRPL